MKKLIYIVAIFILFCELQSQVPDKEISPDFLGATSYGKEFWLTIPPCFADESAGWDNFIKIFVTSTVKTPVVVEVPGKGFFVTKSTVANGVIEFNLQPHVGQPYTKTGPDPNVPEQIFPGVGLHIYADHPIVCYVVIRYKYTSDGFLAIPVSALGKEYIVAGYNVDAMFKEKWNYKLPNMTGIVAAFHDTKVKFTLGGNPQTRTAGGMKPGESKEFTLSKGDVWMASTNTDGGDLSGSLIVSNKPVGVVTGNQCANIPNGNQWCDYIAEMDLPTYIWGKNYIVPKVPNRKYPSIIRIFAKEPNTKVYQDGKLIATLTHAGGIQGEAFIDKRMSTFSTPPTPPTSVAITSNNPIGITLYNTGTQEDNNNGNSDPFMMAISPIEQFQREIMFCTPGIAGAMGFPENYVNLVYETDEYGLMPDEFEFANVIGGQFKWANLKSKFPDKDELLPYKINGKSYAVKLITLPGDGAYKIRSKTKPFAAYSFGYSSYDSYGYPTAAGCVDLEKKDTTPPVPNYTIDSSGNVIGATITDMPEDSRIRANMSMIVIDPVQSYNYNFTYDDFIPGEARTVAWELKLIDPSKDGKAVLLFVDRRGNDTTITITYSADSNPYSVKLISPKDSSDKLLTDVNFSWHKVALSQYRLLIDEKPEFNSKLKSFDLTDTTKLVSGLNQLTTYYWKVLSLRNGTVLATSKTWTFKTYKGLPQKVSLISPFNGTKALKTNVRFDWTYQYQFQPDFYEIEISNDLLFKDIVYSKDSILTTSLLINLPKNRDYFWHVRAKNDIGISVWSETWKLNVTNNAPRLNYPPDNSINVSLASIVRWEDISAPAYQLQISTSKDFLNLVVDSNNINSNTCDFSLMMNLTYYWRVRAIDTIAQDWSEEWKFETIPNSPVEFDLTFPPDKSVRQEYNPTLRWTSAGKYVDYTVLVSVDPNMLNDIQTFSTKNEYLTIPFVPGLTYYWKVSAKNVSGDAVSRQLWSFKTGSILGVENTSTEGSIYISPNPTSDFIEISVGANGRSPLQSDVRIYDVFGQIQTTPNPTPALPASREGVRIDVSGLSSGMYFVRIGDNVSKFIKL